MKAENIKLIQYLNNKVFNIPIYQRKLTWDKYKFDDFYEELNSGFKHKYNNQIFMGSIFLVFDQANSFWEICDGQQRTTFFIFLLKAFKKVLDEKKELINDDRLTQNKREAKKNFFDKYLTLISNIRINRENELIDFDKLKYAEKSRFSQLIDKFRTDMTDADEIFDKFNFIIYCLESINLTLNVIESSDDFNDVFHSLNSKNVPLSDWDILRNFVYKSNSLLNENYLEKIDHYVSRNKDDKNQNKINFKNIDKVLSAFYMTRKKIVIKNEKEKLQLIESLIKNDFQDELNHLLNSFESIIYFLNNEENKELKELKVIFRFIEKLNLKQIEKLFLWTIIEYDGFKNIEKIQLRRVLLFYKKLIINYIYFVTINNQRANFFERFIKKQNFLNEVFQKNYDYNLIFENFEEMNLFFVDENLEKAKNDPLILKRLNENYKMVYLLILLHCDGLADYSVLSEILTFKKVMFIESEIMSNYFFSKTSNTPTILDLEQQNEMILNDVETNIDQVSSFIKKWFTNILDDEAELEVKNTQMINSFFDELRKINHL